MHQQVIMEFEHRLNMNFNDNFISIKFVVLFIWNLFAFYPDESDHSGIFMELNVK